MNIQRKHIMAFFIEHMTGDNLPMSAIEVAIRLKIPLKQTEVILAELEKEGYIGSDMGYPTGYAMVASPDEMHTIWEEDRRKSENVLYKDGRTINMNFRINPDKKAMIVEEAKKHGKSQADFILWCIEQTLKQEEQSE